MAIEGDGATLTMSAKSRDTFIFSGSGVENLSVEGLILRSAAGHDNVSGIFMVGAKGSRLGGLRLENLEYGLKLGSGETSSGLEVAGIVARDCVQPFFAADVTDSSFSGMDLQADSTTLNQYHTVYLERENHRLTFKDMTLSGGGRFCLQLYSNSGPSSDLTFENVVARDATDRKISLSDLG